MVSKRSILSKPVPRPIGCLVLIAVTAVCWWVFETRAERTVLYEPARVYRDPDHRLRKLDPGIGTNSDGLRGTPEADQIGDSDVVVFFCGDSFVYGPNMKPDGTIAALFERGLREHYPGLTIDVVNGGWPSSSPLLGLRLLRDIGAKYHPDLVLYGFDMSDFRDDLMYRNLLDRRGPYRLAGFAPATLWVANKAAKTVLPEGLYRRVFKMPSDRFFPVNQPLDESRPWMMASWRNLLAINEFAHRSLDADFRLVVFPRNFQYSRWESPESWERGDYEPLGPWVLEPFRFFHEQSVSSPFPVYSLLPAFRNTDVFPTCYPRDPHWTPAGTAVAADALVTMAVDGGWLEHAIGRRETDPVPSSRERAETR